MKKIPKAYGIPLSDQKFPVPGEPFDTDFDEHSEFFHHLMSLKMKDAMMSDEERTSPDTFGCDCIFLEHFITPQMEDDFSLIARDFLLHEYPNIKDHEMVCYVDTEPGDNWPDRIFERYILNLMMNAVNFGSQYAKNLFLYLHKTYYRKEYQQLKRFNRLSGGELMSLATNENGGTSPVAFARLLTISRLYGIDISVDCNFIYLFLNDYHNEDESDLDWDFMDSISGIYNECKEEIQELFDSVEEMYDMRYECDRFLGNVLRSEGFVEDYVMLCNDRDHGIEQRLARTLAVLKKTYKNRKYSKEELIMYASIYEAAGGLISSVEDMDSRINEVLYGERGTDYFDAFPPLFKAEDVVKGRLDRQGDLKSKAEKKTVESEETDTPKYREETLVSEIDALHRRIHAQEADIKELRDKIAADRKITEENIRLKEQMEAEHRELAALREHVYSLTEDDDLGETVPVEDMKKYLAGLRIIIVGGHSNWRQKMKQEFPDWVYINATVSGTLEASVVDKADHVYFFTDTISHSTYFKYMNVVKERGVDFGYIHGVNIENTVRKIYREMKKEG